MATALSGLFSNYIDPQQQRLEQQQAFAKQLGQTTDPRAFIAAVGSNMGSTLGNFIPGMMGVKSTNEKIKEILDSVKDIEDPVEQAITAAKKFSAAGMSKEAQMMYQHVQEAKAEQADLELKQERIKSIKAQEAGRTASERLANELSALEQRLAKGETLSASELAKARVQVEQARKDKTYIDQDTKQLITMKGFNVDQAVPNLMAKLRGDTTAPSQAPGQAVQPGQVTSQVGGTTTAETPASIAQRSQGIKAAEAKLADIDMALKNAEDAMQTYEKGWATGGVLGSLTKGLEFTDAGALQNYVTGINAQQTFDALSQMRAASQTGASGLGQVTQNEFAALGAKMRGLKVGSPKFKEDLQYIQGRFKEMRRLYQQDLLIAQTKAKYPGKSNQEIIDAYRKKAEYADLFKPYAYAAQQ